ncbi:beta-phosphoglucomutase [Paenibacillus donghaensis]|uniref:Beta-phosphoglucomutase n=1 Tax=Paenibacillus donghaensis TaxID=414771 RepID=A0A2Z2K3Q3_9BACL|nr:beta-phosphoglucomutase [Paenibacillus donghaensis]ASA20096.1 beta-phosphoglucomutase [Paenibacillus donghaensis]
MTQIKACLFDLDGVLVDTAKYHYIAWKELAESLGFLFTEQDNERLKGVSRVASLNILLEIGGLTLDEEEKAQLAERKNNRYIEYIAKMDSSEILPGALKFLEECRDQGIKVALGSASKNAMTILNNTGLTPYFDAIIDGTHTSAAKPDPEVFLLGATAVNIHPEHCVVFEDAEAGIIAATRAGMISVGIGSPQTLRAANMVVPSLAHISVAVLRESFAVV